MKLKKLTEKHHDAIECMFFYFNLSFYEAAAMDLTDLEIRECLIEVAKKYPSNLLREFDNMITNLKVCMFGYDEKIRTNQEHAYHTFMFYSMMYQLIDLDAVSDLDIWVWSNEHETFVNRNGISLN